MRKRLLAMLLATLMLLQGVVFGGASAETTEKVVVNFSASNIETTRLLNGYLFYTDWKTGDDLPNDTGAGQGADVSGSALNGAHKKMYLKSTVTLTALADGVDVTTCWKNIGFRLRSAKVNGAEQAANFYYVTPDKVTMVDGTFEVSIPLSEIQAGAINWADVRQLNITCNVADTYKQSATFESTQIKFKLENTRIVREYTDGEVDTDELQDLVNATIPSEEDYTTDSLNAYKQAIETGKTVLANTAATQEEVDAASTAIKEAKKALVEITYFGALQALLDEEVSNDGYNADSVAAYEQALQNGAVVAANADATQQQVNQALMAIMTAKMNRVLTDGDPMVAETVATFSTANKSYDYLQYGTSFFPAWITADGASDAGIDLSGDADNGSDGSLYLQMRLTFTAMGEGVDVSKCWKQLAVRIRSAHVNGAEKSSSVFYIPRELLVEDSVGVYTIRLPLKSVATNALDWSDVRDVFVQAELNAEYHLKDETGAVSAGTNEDICFTMSDMAVIRKTQTLKGDVNGKDEVTAEDALLALQAATKKIALTAVEEDAADVDGTAGVTASDALLILQCATKKIGGFEQEEERKMVAFTFDDGPSEYTEYFLDELAKRDAHVTFFMIGTQIEQYPELVTRMAEEGHSTGIHGYEHKKGMTSMTEEEMIAEVENCADLIEELTGERPKYIRAPWEATAAREKAYFAEVDLREIGYVGYIADFVDANKDKDILVNAHCDANGNCKIQDGEILLLHEVYPTSIEAALELIDMLQADGYEIVSVEELLEARLNGGQAGAKYSRVIELQ